MTASSEDLSLHSLTRYRTLTAVKVIIVQMPRGIEREREREWEGMPVLPLPPAMVDTAAAITTADNSGRNSSIAMPLTGRQQDDEIHAMKASASRWVLCTDCELLCGDTNTDCELLCGDTNTDCELLCGNTNTDCELLCGNTNSDCELLCGDTNTDCEQCLSFTTACLALPVLQGRQQRLFVCFFAFEALKK